MERTPGNLVMCGSLFIAKSYGCMSALVGVAKDPTDGIDCAR